jgi:carbon-monoxide dehydrogenase medium subunit/6-hydroxypseudooxynicotine dehydrogenase subunit alpha
VKPAPFEYDRAESVDHALTRLAEHADDAKVLAGGQSLMPLLNFRLARPARLIDINGLGELASLRRSDGVLHIGALTRQAMLERATTVRNHWPLLHEALAYLAHPQIRNRGTVGGSVAHADPAAELPVVLTALGAAVTVRSTRGSRQIDAADLFVTHLTTSLEPDELLTAIAVPPLPPMSGSAFVEYARRHGDFGLGGAAVVLAPGNEGRCDHASIVLLAAAPTPLRAHEAEGVLAGRMIDDDAAAEAAACAVRGIAPTGDIHGDTQYRRRLIEGLVRRAVLTAARRLGPRSGDA